MPQRDLAGIRRDDLSAIWSKAERSRGVLLRLYLRVGTRRVRRWLGGVPGLAGGMAKISAIAGARANRASPR
jgi:hypothetical protein